MSTVYYLYRSSREEILRCAVRLALDSLQMLLSHTSFCVTFFLLYAAMWTWDIRFDTRFFAVASCLLGYLEVSVLDFGASIHTIAQYISAEQRIQVSRCDARRGEKVGYLLPRRFCSWLNQNEIIDWHLRRYMISKPSNRKRRRRPSPRWESNVV